MSEMVERVAQSLIRIHFDHLQDWYKDELRELARTIIAVMREPTAAQSTRGMIRGAVICPGREVQRHETDSIYRAMIDEALK